MSEVLQRTAVLGLGGVRRLSSLSSATARLTLVFPFSHQMLFIKISFLFKNLHLGSHAVRRLINDAAALSF